MKPIRFAALIVLLVAGLRAEPYQEAKTGPSVRATGTAVVHARPDEARIEVGVVTHADTAKAAASENAARLQETLDRLRAAAGPKSEIRTIGYSVTPNYAYSGGARSIQGYNAVNTLAVTTGDLAAVGKIIDAATAGGANQIRQVEFRLKDETAARAEALRKASREAMASAQAMAAALGLKLGRVLSLEQSGNAPVRPMMMMDAARVAAAPTPIEPGTVDIQASVTLVVALE